jgi:hypothetical protein
MNRTLETFVVVFLSSFFGFLIFFPIYLAITETSKEPSPPKFEVVDTYKGCDVVRYNPDSVATYKYLLKCPK